MDGMTETDLPPTESGTVSGMIAGTFHYTLTVSVVQCVCVCVCVVEILSVQWLSCQAQAPDKHRQVYWTTSNLS